MHPPGGVRWHDAIESELRGVLRLENETHVADRPRFAVCQLIPALLQGLQHRRLAATGERNGEASAGQLQILANDHALDAGRGIKLD